MKIFMSDLPKHMNSHASFWLFLRATLIDISPEIILYVGSMHHVVIISEWRQCCLSIHLSEGLCYQTLHLFMSAPQFHKTCVTFFFFLFIFI